MVKFTTINHTAREHLDLSLLEYTICDSIFQLQSNPKNTNLGWCDATNEYLAGWVNISKRGFLKVCSRLEEKGLLERNHYSKRTTQKWYDAVINHKRKNNPLSAHTDSRLKKFDQLWSRYPKQIGKEKAYQSFLKTIKSNEDYKILNEAITRYKLSGEVQAGRIKNFINFLPDYKDWAKYKEE